MSGGTLHRRAYHDLWRSVQVPRSMYVVVTEQMQYRVRSLRPVQSFSLTQRLRRRSSLERSPQSTALIRPKHVGHFRPQLITQHGHHERKSQYRFQQFLLTPLMWYIFSFLATGSFFQIKLDQSFGECYAWICVEFEYAV